MIAQTKATHFQTVHIPSSFKWSYLLGVLLDPDSSRYNAILLELQRKNTYSPDPIVIYAVDRFMYSEKSCTSSTSAHL